MQVYVPDKEHGWLAATLLSLDAEAAEVLVSPGGPMRIVLGLRC